MAKRARVAIVDDDAGMRDAVADLLTSIGHEPCCFASAGEFLADGRAADVDCAILDIRMPGMSGLELQDALNDRGGPPPIIFMSSCADDAARSRASAAGARCVLDKPVDDVRLVACIEAALRSR